MTPSMPEKTAVPSAWRISAPAPVAITSGRTPRMGIEFGSEALDPLLVDRQPPGAEGLPDCEVLEIAIIHCSTSNASGIMPKPWRAASTPAASWTSCEM